MLVIKFMRHKTFILEYITIVAAKIYGIYLLLYVYQISGFCCILRLDSAELGSSQVDYHMPPLFNIVFDKKNTCIVKMIEIGIYVFKRGIKSVFSLIVKLLYQKINYCQDEMTDLVQMIICLIYLQKRCGK
jgi:hypothetical protein